MRIVVSDWQNADERAELIEKAKAGARNPDPVSLLGMFVTVLDVRCDHPLYAHLRRRS
jgi:hypothetical protein